MKYFDGHAHINTQYFKDNVEEAIVMAKEHGVDKMVMPSTDVKNSLRSIELSKKHDFLYASVGIHPADGFDVKECDYLNEINPDDVVAVGEVGIDLYRDTNPALDIQKQVFIKHIEYAIKHNKVIIIHMRDAFQEVYDILKEYKPQKFVMHSFVGDLEWANKFMALGGFISFSGIVTFKNAPELKEVAKAIPLEKILVETDAPFLTPVPFRGKSNTPAYVKYTTDYIGSIREEQDEDVIKAIYENTVNLYLK